MKRLVAVALIAMLLLPGVAYAGSATDAALGLGAFAALGTILLGAAALSHPAVLAAAPVVYAPPPAAVYVPAPQVVYAPPPPPQVVYVPAAPPQVVYAPAPQVVYAPVPQISYAPAPAYGYYAPYGYGYGHGHARYWHR
jgi:hypothetical protein